MSAIRSAAIATAAVFMLWTHAPAFAQGRVDQTGTGGGPLSTATAPNTRSDGVTMPPGGGAGVRSPARTRLDRTVRRRNDRIEGSICNGCGK